MTHKTLDVGLQDEKVRDHHVIYFPTKLKRNQFDCKLTLGSHYIDAADKIHSFLNENELEQLVQQTQFGNLIRCAKDYLNSNQLLWFLMSRQSLDCGNDEFWMVFRKKPIRFSLLEYCLITGLNCSNVYLPIPEDDSFLHRHFSGKSSLCLRDLKAKIDGFGNGVGEEVDVEKLKLASLYFLVVVLGPQRKNKNEVVNVDWVKLVDDFESFNKYPWGRVAFDEVLFGLRKNLEEKFKSFKNLAKRRKNDAKFSGYGSYHISGFIHPLQIFAYECFPSVAEVFATRKDGANVPLPRMCHWVTKKWRKNHFPSMEDVTKAFSGDPEEAIVGMLTPTDAELLSAHYLTGDFVDFSPNVVTLRISELISQGATVVCSEHPLADQDQDEDIEMDDAASEATPPRPHISRPPSSHTHRRSSNDRVVRTYSRTSRDKRQTSLLPPPLHIQSPSHTDRTQSSPLHRAGPSLPATYEVRLTRLEDRLTVLQKEQTDGFAQIMDMLRHIQKDMLSMKQMIEDGKARSPVHTDLFYGGETSGRIPETLIEEADLHFRDTGADRIIEEADPHLRETGADTIGVTEGTSGRTVDDVGTTLEIRAKMLNDSVFTAINALTFEQRISRVVESSWPRIKIEIDHATETSRKSGLVLSYSKQWFVDLMTPGCWLYDDRSNNSRALAVSDLTHVGQNSPYMISRDSIQNGGLSQIAESTANHSKKLQDDMQELGQKIKHHEDNVKYLKHHKNKLEESIVDMQVTSRKYHTSSSTKKEDPSHNEKKIIQNILKHEGSAAALWYRMKNQPETQASYLTLTKDVLGIVATLGMVDDGNLSRLLSEYLDLDTMLAIVCKTYEGVKALETYNRQGLIDKSLGLCALGVSTGRPLDGRFRIICLEKLRPYVGDFIDDDPQQRLDLLKPRLVNGEIPPGFLGFAVNMITIDSANLNGISNDGRNLRESLFYNLFSNLQVYRSREDMLKALPFISNGAVSLDGGVIKSPGVFDMGQQRGDMDVMFPNGSDRFNLPVNYIEIENRLKETEWEKTRTMGDLQIEQSLLDLARFNYEKKKQEFVQFLAHSSSFTAQHQGDGNRLQDDDIE